MSKISTMPIRITQFLCLVTLCWFGNALASETLRPMVPLDGQWQFIKDSSSTPAELLQRTPNQQWQVVSVPHTFNADDADDGGGYFRGAGWYQTDFNLGDIEQIRSYFLQFDGAALHTEVWLNNHKVGQHSGGYTRFRFDVSPYLQQGRNHLIVRVDNSRNPAIAPLAGDFSVFGGLYKKVFLFSTAAVHIDTMDYASSGVYATISDVSSDSAKIAINTRIQNTRSVNAHVVLKHIIKSADDTVVKTIENSLEAGAQQLFENNIVDSISNPHLWQGVDDPYLYTLETQLISTTDSSNIIDSVSQHIGFRHIHIDPSQGLLLNGKPYAVHGVNIHLTQLPGKGTAVSDAEITADLQQLDELGVTGLRLAHYPHPQITFEFANQHGYLVWSEVPAVSEVNDSEAFLENLKLQLREMIRQNYNHPSVFVWGIGNEIYKQNANSNLILASLQALAKQEDPNRYTVYANCCSSMNSGHAIQGDINASNVYSGWYAGQDGVIGDWVARNHKENPTKSMAISEFGGGGSLFHQQQNPQRPDTAGNWHPEQFLSQLHEDAWLSLKDKSYLWANFIWVGFDFASDGRNEGDSDGINDKGLITYDGKTRKDAYYWYQANWSKKPMVYITSRRHVQRHEALTDIKVYSNQSHVTLELNGKTLGTKEVINHRVIWQDVKLAAGENSIQAFTTDEDQKLVDQVSWYLH
ncbi:glycoside hydrolase family 2 TIM barrel-domain containing protein [Alteromonadaceae bacterium BrNp21-10]|nr:glycoside hydrolase family 2 TIM barrel-domain containing protein [Alteromonadaceae bacterium BrNp21-10]